MRNTYEIKVRKPNAKSPLGRPRHGKEDNTKIDLCCEVPDCIHLIHDRIKLQALVYTYILLKVGNLLFC
jgi:hypothetical protein